MNSIEDRLRTDGEAWQQLIDNGRRAVAPAPERDDRRRRWLAPAFGGAVVIAIAVTVALVSHRGPDRHVSNAALPWRSHTFNGLTLRFPAGWHAVAPSFTPLGGEPLAYLVNRTPLAQCRPGGGCGAPIRELTGNAAVVGADRLPGGPEIHTTTTVSGWPAIVRRDKRCGHGGTYGISATLIVLNDQIIDVSACTSSTDPADRRALDRIISTLRYADPSGVTISGRFLEEGGPAGTPPRALPGLVTLEPVGVGPAVVVQVGVDGRYSAEVLPGRYMISGNSPRIQGGAATCPTVPTPVTARHSITADVICSIN
jgi:hypothetical protein